MDTHKLTHARIQSSFDVVRGVREMKLWMSDVGKQLVCFDEVGYLSALRTRVWV